MKNSKYFFLAILATSLFFTSCDDDDGAGPENPEEVITTVELTFTEGGNSSTFTVTDTDGDSGGNAPVVETIQLDANKTYTVAARFLDESNASDVEDITEEVAEEDDEHLVCYTTTGELTALAITDTDSAGNPLGLTATVTTTEAGTATLMLVLKHQPDKAAATPCSTGDTDVEVTFPVEIQ